MIETVFHFEDVPVRVSHERCLSPEGRTEDGLLVRAPQQDAETLTTITVGPHDRSRRVYVFWQPLVSRSSFDLLLVREILFLGGGPHSAVIDLATMSLRHQNEPTLFWSFERRSDFVLELGELECFLYSLDGRLVDRTDVDPPYEINETDSGLNLISIVAGSRWLRFPE